ncbi:SRPBCC family protein [Phytoactinopolyspora mesophila]|uniref:Carbon monoxide dehydrogenase n=1 Tax=Phytoactinopolyspora mesophila TaxID=2650750 RepID=A0A7K3MAQ8_9ACTN|nr:SRPBCC family protein [Phytoactinopolyspora mesophila]NDL60346.1 hypothetical protein [Phytoactinopolyspora mesophila]
MQLQHEFTLPIPPDQAWSTLLDVERIAPCMPGAALDRIDGDDFSGRVTLKVGPLRLNYRGDARLEEKDPQARRLVIAAEGQEARGSGTAKAAVTASLSAVPDGTRVALQTDLALTGRPAQFGRGLVNEVAGTIIGQFAERLSAEMSNGGLPQQALPDAGADAPGAGNGRPSSSPGSSSAVTDTDENSLDVLTLLRTTVGTRGLIALGGIAAVVAAFLLGRRRSRSWPAADGRPPGWPAVYVIDAGEK